MDTTVVGRLPDSAESIGRGQPGERRLLHAGRVRHGDALGLDTLVSRASRRANDADDARRWLAQGVWRWAHPLLMGVVLAVGALLPSLGVNPDVLRLARPYLHATNWSTLPLLIYAAFRRYLQAVGRVWPVLFALTSANLVNLAGNWVFVFGKLGAPALGVTRWAGRRRSGVHGSGPGRRPCSGESGTRPRRGRVPVGVAAARGSARRLIGLGARRPCVTLEVGVFALGDRAWRPGSRRRRWRLIKSC
ncbi:MAG: MATE family efflux transporter [Isosphaeraceae bacterium]